MKNENFYYTITIKKENENLFYSFALTVSKSYNLLNKLNEIKNIYYVMQQKTLKAAEQQSNFNNESFEDNGTYWKNWHTESIYK